MKKRFLQVIGFFIITITGFSQGGAIKVFPSGDIIIGGLNIGGFGLNMQPNGFTYQYTQSYGAYSWSNLVKVNHVLQLSNIVQDQYGLFFNAWDRGDGYRFGRGGFHSGADLSFYENIEDLKNPLEMVLGLRGVSYKMIGESRKKDSVTIIDKYGVVHKFPKSRDDWKDTTKFKPGIAERLKEETDYPHFGVIAQEVQQIAPEAVRTMPDGTLAVEYNALIPLLIESIKILNSKIDSCCQAYSPTKHANSSQKSLEESMDDQQKSVLFQNAPNPFTKTTIIRYRLHAGVRNASIMIFTIEGAFLKTIPGLDPQKGETRLSGNEMKPGIYLYSLICDGMEVDTKRMILTE